jgi:exopolysaccharide biosynthesis polyprenyl glycosylphosphotransferase
MSALPIAVELTQYRGVFMVTGGRQAADGGTRNLVGSSSGLVHTTSSADASSPVPYGSADIATGTQRLLVAVPAGEQLHVVAAPNAPDHGLRSKRYLLALATIDFAAVALAAAIAGRMQFEPARPEPLISTLTLLALPVAWLVLVALHHGFEQPSAGTGQQEFVRIFRSFVHLVVFVAVAAYVIQAEWAREIVLVALPLAFLLDLGGRFAARRWLSRRQGREYGVRAVLAVGDAGAVSDFADAVLRDRSAAMVVRGACLLDGHAQDAEVLAAAGIRRLGDIDTVVEAAHEVGADAVAVVSANQVGSERLRSIAWQLEGTGMDLLVSPGLEEVAGRRIQVRSVAWSPLLHVEQPEFRGIRRLLKGAMDRAIALFALTCLLPVFAVVTVAVRLSSPGPALFRQTRVGRDGKTFRMLKFRSMFVDAESRLADLKSQNVHRVGPLFKLHDDPRVTRVGRILRRYSLDELPQLINVLLGHMSLVGPRPPLPSEVLEYRSDVRRRLLVKPGITGLWQVSGRSDLSWSESVRLDLRYVENWSPALDLMILWKTASAVLRGSGAY